MKVKLRNDMCFFPWLQVRRPTGPINLDDVFFPNETLTETVDYVIGILGNSSRAVADAIIEGTYLGVMFTSSEPTRY